VKRGSTPSFQSEAVIHHETNSSQRRGGRIACAEDMHGCRIRLRSVNFPDRCIVARADGQCWIDPVGDDEWIAVPGLADSNGVSFESCRHRGRFLRHRDFKLYCEPNKGGPFHEDATFYVNSCGPGLTFQSQNFREHRLRHCNFRLLLEKQQQKKGLFGKTKNNGPEDDFNFRAEMC